MANEYAPMKRCGAIVHSRKKAAPDDPASWACKGFAMPNGRCHRHGGSTPPAAHRAKNGLFVKAWHRDAHQAAYERLLSHEKLMDLGEAVAALGVLVERCGERMSELDTASLRKRAFDWMTRARELSSEAQRARAAGDEAKAAELGAQVRDLMDRAYSLIRDGVSEDEAAKEMREAIVAQAERREAAWRIHLSASNVINVQQLTVAIRVILQIVADEAGPEAAERIAGRVDRFMRGRADVAMLTREGIVDATDSASKTVG